MPRQIDIINRFYYPVTAGIETVLTQLLRHIPDIPFSITAHVSADTLDKSNVLPSHAEYEGVVINRYKTVKKAFLPNVPWNTTNAVVITNFTLIPHFIVLLNVVIRALFNRKKFRFIFFPCGGFTPDWNSFPPMKRIVKKIVHAVSAGMFNYAADTVIAISQWERNGLIKAGIRPHIIDFMGLGVEDEAFSLPYSPVNKEHPYFIQVSRIHPIKNIESVIHALAHVPEPISYVIAGSIEDHEYYKNLQELVKKLGLESRVIFKEKVSIEQKYSLIDGALFMVHMSRNESFGLSIHEGISRGKACILANNSAMPEAIENGVGGYVIDENNINKLIEKISELSNPKNNHILQLMGEHNKHAMKEKRWREVSSHFVECAIG